jgi:hypothetical protein
MLLRSCDGAAGTQRRCDGGTTDLFFEGVYADSPLTSRITCLPRFARVVDATKCTTVYGYTCRLSMGVEIPTDEGM